MSVRNVVIKIVPDVPGSPCPSYSDSHSTQAMRVDEQNMEKREHFRSGCNSGGQREGRQQKLLSEEQGEE